MTNDYFAACGRGLEPALAGELRGLWAADIEERRGGVAFRGDRKVAYAANLWLRSAIRVQEQIFRAPSKGPKDLYAAVAAVDWTKYMRLDQTLAVDASVRDSEVTHSGYAALTVKDAIVDQFRGKFDRRPDVNTESPDLPLKLVLKDDVALLYRDMSGESLHKRGWRPIQVKSPLNESTAAALLLLSGWDRSSTLVDPMCGSGTFPIEAAMLAADRAPGLKRSFAFERWPDHDTKLWVELVADAKRRAKPKLPFLIEGADRHEGALALAARGAASAGVADLVRFTVADCRAFMPAKKVAVVFTNPPYGERLGEGEDLLDSWKALGNFLHRCKGASAYVLSGNAELTKHLGLRASKKWVVINGQIECRLIRYDVREDSRKSEV